MTNNYKCILPFSHLAIRPNGNIYPCCNYNWDAEIPLDLNLNKDNVFDHEYLVNIRNKMLNDEYVDGCNKCYESETQFGKSMRTSFTFENEANVYSEDLYTSPEIKYLDISISNVCNNRCRMCGPELSTKWYSDYKQLFNKQYKGISKQDYSKLDVSKLNYLKLLGGEPLMEQDTIISLLSRSNLSQLSVMITTNGTILPNEELLNLLKKCKKVFWIVSIDSFGAMNNFLRKDSDWNIVDFNLKYLNKQFPKSVKVQSVCSVYNCNLMDKLADYLRNEGILQQIVIVDNTDLFFECMRPNILPDVIRNKILENISDINIKNILTDEFQKNNFSLRNLEYFLKVDDQLNKVRKEHWKELNPWLWEEITQFMKEEQKNETRI